MKTATMNVKKSAPCFVDDNHVLVTKEFAKNARIFGMPEYKMWKEIRLDCPTAEMVTKTIKKNPDKKTSTKNMQAGSNIESVKRCNRIVEFFFANKIIFPEGESVK